MTEILAVCINYLQILVGTKVNDQARVNKSQISAFISIFAGLA